MKFRILFLLALGLMFSCKKDVDLREDCISKQLALHKMIPYIGQEIGGKTFLELYAFEGNQYYFLNNHYADILYRGYDCDGNSICKDGPTPECYYFSLNAKFVKIVGIEP